MATSLDFSRAVNLDITHAQGRKLTGALTFARDDDVAVDLSAKKLYWRVWESKWVIRTAANAKVDWNTTDDSGKISVSTATVTFSAVVEESDGTDLTHGTYYHELYNSTDNDLIAYGDLELL